APDFPSLPTGIAVASSEPETGRCIKGGEEQHRSGQFARMEPCYRSGGKGFVGLRGAGRTVRREREKKMGPNWTFRVMPSFHAMIAVVLLFTAPVVPVSPSIASDREEISGQGTLTRSRIPGSIVEVSDCGDLADNTTFIRSVARTGTDTFS